MSIVVFRFVIVRGFCPRVDGWWIVDDAGQIKILETARQHFVLMPTLSFRKPIQIVMPMRHKFMSVMPWKEHVILDNHSNARCLLKRVFLPSPFQNNCCHLSCQLNSIWNACMQQSAASKAMFWLQITEFCYILKSLNHLTKYRS